MMEESAAERAAGFPVRSRVAVHFPGYEPLDAALHRERFARALAQSSAAFGFEAEAGPLGQEAGAPAFTITAQGSGWSTRTRMIVLDHAAIIETQKARPLARRLAAGFGAFAAALGQGALGAYLRRAWRFALFFLFPFLLVASAMAGCAALAAAPALFGAPPSLLLVSVPAAALAFRFGFIPWSDRLHTLHLFADWEMALALSRMDDAAINARLDAMADTLAAALRIPADEHLLTAHSMGGAMLPHALGLVLERDPQALAGRTVSLVTLGGPGHQVSLLSRATVLRRRIGLILAHPAIRWLDVQCLTDICAFYGARIARDTGHADLPEPLVQRIRMKTMITPERYARIKRDFLRVHRQFVLGSDRPSRFDFQLMTAGPSRATVFATTDETRLPPA